MIHVGKVISLYPAATGKAQEGRMQTIERFSQIGTKAVILPRFFRYERNHVEVECALAGGGDLQARLWIAGDGCQLQCVVAPFVAEASDFPFGQFVAGGAEHAHGQRPGKALDGARREFEGVCVPFDEVHPPVAFVFQGD